MPARSKRPSADAHPEVATTALHGDPRWGEPTRVDVDERIPASWPRDYVEHLVETRAARVPGKGEALRPRNAPHTTVDGKVAGQ